MLKMKLSMMAAAQDGGNASLRIFAAFVHAYTPTISLTASFQAGAFSRLGVSLDQNTSRLLEFYQMT